MDHGPIHDQFVCWWGLVRHLRNCLCCEKSLGKSRLCMSISTSSGVEYLRLKSPMNCLFFVDENLAELKKRSASDLLGKLVPYGSGSEFSADEVNANENVGKNMRYIEEVQRSNIGK